MFSWRALPNYRVPPGNASFPPDAAPQSLNAAYLQAIAVKSPPSPV
jgi:hypothetical protein